MPTTLTTTLSALAMLGTAGLTGLGGVLTLWGILQGSQLLRRRGVQLAMTVSSGYLLVLIATGLLSTERVLPVGAEKYFCELDCHLAYRVGELAQVPGARNEWAVRIVTRFDQATISPRRGDGPLSPNPRRVALLGSDGVRYPATAATSHPFAESSTPLTRALRPGEAYSTWVEAVLPAGVQPARLELTEDLAVNRLMIGNEQGLFHQPILLQLPYQ